MYLHTPLNHTNNLTLLGPQSTLPYSLYDRLKNSGIRHHLGKSTKVLDNRIRQLRREIQKLRDSIERHIELPRDILVRERVVQGT